MVSCSYAGFIRAALRDGVPSAGHSYMHFGTVALPSQYVPSIASALHDSGFASACLRVASFFGGLNVGCIPYPCASPVVVACVHNGEGGGGRLHSAVTVAPDCLHNESHCCLWVPKLRCVCPCRYGSWSLMEYIGQPVAAAPKYLAMLDAARDGAANALPTNASTACVTVSMLNSFIPVGLHPDVCTGVHACTACFG